MIPIFKRQPTKLTEQEQIRFNEIVFYNLIVELMSKTSNPIKIQDFVEVVCNLSGCSIPILNSVINIIMTEDRRYIPIQKEMIYIMFKSGLPVREICKSAKLSQRTYYRHLHNIEYPIEPKFDTRQYQEMMKFLDTLQALIEPLERRGF